MWKDRVLNKITQCLTFDKLNASLGQHLTSVYQKKTCNLNIYFKKLHNYTWLCVLSNKLRIMRDFVKKKKNIKYTSMIFFLLSYNFNHIEEKNLNCDDNQSRSLLTCTTYKRKEIPILWKAQNLFLNWGVGTHWTSKKIHVYWCIFFQNIYLE